MENINIAHFYCNSVEYITDTLLNSCMTLISKNIPMHSVYGQTAPVKWFNNNLKQKRNSSSIVKLISDNSSNILYKIYINSYIRTIKCTL